MALTPEIRASQAGAVGVTDAATDLQVSQLGTLAVAIWPTEFIYASQAGTVSVTAAATDLQVSQLGVMVVARGRVSDPTVRAWTFTLDGHDFYVLRLGNDATIVYDVFAEQWYDWGSEDSPLWSAFTGHNWLGGRALGASYGSNIIVGADGNGAVYFLDPTGNYDDDAASGPDLPRPYLREIMGQIAVRGYDTTTCYGVSLMGAIGETLDATLTAITLFTSDDDGHTYDEHETINVDPGETQARVDWNSGLGSFDAPGRLFLIQDRGALQRIDWLDMATDED